MKSANARKLDRKSRVRFGERGHPSIAFAASMIQTPSSSRFRSQRSSFPATNYKRNRKMLMVGKVKTPGATLSRPVSRIVR
jgi:hypothetical protein